MKEPISLPPPAAPARGRGPVAPDVARARTDQWRRGQPDSFAARYRLELRRS